MYQVPLAACPYCHQGTLANGYFCAFCGAQLRPFPGQQGSPPAAQQAATPPPQQRAPPAQQQPPPQQYQRAPPQQAPAPAQYGRPASAPPQQAGYGTGGSQAIVCPECGRPNDPWLTHCKACGRPLMRS